MHIFVQQTKSPDNGLGVFYLPLADALATCGLSCNLQAKKKVSGHFFFFLSNIMCDRTACTLL